MKWHIDGTFDDDVRIDILDEENNPVVDIAPFDGEWLPEDMAKAHLIAAAPELLEHLGTMTALAHIYVGDDPKGLALVAKATAAIFKAKGELR